MDAVHRGGRPGVANGGGGQDMAQTHGRDSRPRGVDALRELLPVGEDGPDRWDRGGSDSELGRDLGRRGSTHTL